MSLQLHKREFRFAHSNQKDPLRDLFVNRNKKFIKEEIIMKKYTFSGLSTNTMQKRDINAQSLGVLGKEWLIPSFPRIVPNDNHF
jgi:hypothetical protein